MVSPQPRLPLRQPSGVHPDHRGRRPGRRVGGGAGLGVVGEAESLFILAPWDARLQAELNVDSKDIGKVAIGQSARLK